MRIHCARGSFIVDLAWKDGKVTEVKIQSKNGEKLNLGPEHTSWSHK